jgi:hypothetical protein
LWAAASSGASATEAGRVVRHTVGAAAQRGKAPPVRPATSLIGQLEALPRAWSAFTTAAPAALSSGRLGADLASALGSAWLARLGTVAPAGPGSAAQLAAAADTAVHSATRTAATNAVKAYLASAVEPVLRASVAGLTSAVDTEVAAVMSTPAGALAAAAPKDPALAALATTLHKQLTDEAAAATAAQAATPGSTPLDPGKGAPAQSVTYGTVNMMSDNTAVFRTEQFADLAAQFNDPAHHLRREREGVFTVDKP